MSAGRLPAPFAAPSTHALGLAEAVELGRALGRLPPTLTVFGIEGTTFTAGATPTPAVLAAVPRVAAASIAELRGATLSARVDPSAGGVG